MRDLEHAHLMLRLAKDDLTALEVMESSPRISLGIFGFHAQQVVEKALKAWLSLLGVSYPRTHVLYALFALLEAHGTATISEFRHLQSLTPFGVQFRYEAYANFDEPLDRSEVIRHVNALLTHVETLIRETEQEA
jgi:HEPN domain-containing protein